MRITNQMITGNSLRNMQKSMSEVNTVTQQLTTGKKISKASENPVTAIRALKLRTTVNQLAQYKDKNIPDADSWLKITTTSLTNITNRIKDINDYCVQGSTDSFNSTDRSAIIDGLKELRSMIHSEGNSTYAGRYIFTGYKTDRSLAFTETEDTSIYSYDIIQHFDATALELKNVVTNSVDYTKVDDYINGTEVYEKPDPNQIYRLNLGYEGVEKDNVSIKLSMDGTVYNLGTNNTSAGGFTFEVKGTDEADSYYEVGPNSITLIQETGELVFGEAVYNRLKTASDIEVDYSKKHFNADDLRPEHYFDCTQYTVQPDGGVKTTEYTQPKDGQGVYYEVNFNQSIKVNTEGNKLITHKVGNDINDLIYALEDLQAAENTQKKLKDMLTDVQYASNDGAKKKIENMLLDVDVEVAVKKENMQKIFSANIKNFQDYMSQVTAIESDVGSRMSKLEMIEVRVKEQYASFKELKSKNEDVETDSAIIDFNEAELVYQSALASTGSIMNKTLLDYI